MKLTAEYKQWIDSIRKECSNRGVSYNIEDIPNWASSTDTMLKVYKQGIDPVIVVDFIHSKSKSEPKKNNA